VRVRVGISACLLGREVRWDGGHRRDPLIARLFGSFVEWVPVCPEVELGLGVPREPIELSGSAVHPRLLGTRSGRDLTGAMDRFARRRVDELARFDLAGYVSKSESPSCGLASARIDGRPGATGAFARVLVERLPLLPVEEEARLRDAAIREHFVERVLAHARWRHALARGMTLARLVAFHTAHDLVLRAHSPAAHRRLAKLVARASARRLTPAVPRYEHGFMRALAVPPTPAGHARALVDVIRRLSPDLGAAERAALLRLVGGYRRGRVPLGAVMTVVRRHVRRLDVAELRRQVYLAPATPRCTSMPRW
jgi:uncharacterized protein YbbK (DUF523 family)/uncharacterized protein YbgA (DUF1722 family)